MPKRLFFAAAFLILHIAHAQRPSPLMTTDNETPRQLTTAGQEPDSAAHQAHPRFLTTQTPGNHPDPAYLVTLGRWRTRHVEALTQPDGWLSLAALEWLKPGDTTVGSDPGSTLRLHDAPVHLATFHLAGDTVLLRPPSGGFPDGTTLNHHPAVSVPFSLDAELRHGTLLLTVIKRGDRFYLRVRDSANPARQNFHGLRWYAPDVEYRITARWVPAGMAGNLAVTNVLGQLSHESSPGMAEFTLYGQTIRLFPIVEDPQSLFFIFRDATANTSTYGAGRFLYTGLPSNGLGRPGTIVLDFNQAENPPCAHTPYATCPLPPQQNRLTIPIPAGEQRYDD